MFFRMLSLDNWFLRPFSRRKASTTCRVDSPCARSPASALLIFGACLIANHASAATLQWDHPALPESLTGSNVTRSDDTIDSSKSRRVKLLPISGTSIKSTLPVGTGTTSHTNPLDAKLNQFQHGQDFVPTTLSGAALSPPQLGPSTFTSSSRKDETLPAPLGSSLLKRKFNNGNAFSDSSLVNSQGVNPQGKEEADPENGIIKFLKPLALEPRRRELLTQRYSNGKVQIEREVALDERGNYMNDGKWKMYHTDGELMGIGKFTNGQMTGMWRRVHHDRNHPWFASAEFQGFTFPLVSTADFSDGQLEGLWVIKDRDDRKVIELNYKNGRREGDGNWWYPNSQKRRQLSFKSDLLNGQWQEWNDSGKQNREDWFRNGHRITKNITYFEPGRPETEQSFLEAKLELTQTDDWWNARLSTYQATGEMIQSGPVRAWYDNGQKHMAGYFNNGAKHGEFAWWHPNGNRKLVCQFEDGQRTGRWIWWHENGIKAAQGSFEEDLPIGEWLAWDLQGIATQSPIDGESREVLAKPVLDGDSETDQPGEEGLEELPPQSSPGAPTLELPPPPGQSGTTDSGTTDSGTTDSGTTDSGTTDSGITELGTVTGDAERSEASPGEASHANRVTPSVEVLELNGRSTENQPQASESQKNMGPPSGDQPETVAQDPPPKPAANATNQNN